MTEGSEPVPAGPDADAVEFPATAHLRETLDGLSGVPVAEHVALFDAAHRHLQDTLASLDED